MRVAATLLLLLAGWATADDKAEVAKTKAAIDENAKKLGKKLVTIETADLLVATPLAEVKAKPLAEGAQKAVTVARECLRIAKTDTIYTGKLTLYAFPDNADMKSFARLVEQRRPESDPYSLNLRSAPPYVVVSIEAVAKSDGELAQSIAAWAAAAVLEKKVGIATIDLPGWLQSGFGRACFIRSDSSKQANHKQKMKALLAGKAAKTIWAKDLWSGEKMAERDLVATSFTEFLAFGPQGEKFVDFAKAMKPMMPNGNDVPNIEAALKVLEMTPEQMDAAWKAWALKAK